MAEDETRDAVRARLYDRYDDGSLDNGVLVQGEQWLGRVEEFDQLDPEWTRQWMDYVYGYMYTRTVLDHKTRCLIAVGEHAVLGNEAQLPTHMRSALKFGATPYEILEVFLQASIYVGMPRATRAIEIFREIMVEDGALELTDPVFRVPAKLPR